MFNFFNDHILLPLKAMKLCYLPLLLIYFSYGCSTFSAIGQTFFIKEELNLSAEDLIMIGLWVSLPWNIKMIVGQLVDSVPLWGSPRKSYIYLAALLMALGSLLLVGLAAHNPVLLSVLSSNQIYVSSALLSSLGLLLQDVVADTLCVEVVERQGRSNQEIEKELGMVQILGRLSMSFGMLLVSGLGGWLTHVLSYPILFALTLFIPLISISGCWFVSIQIPATPAPLDRRILAGGLFYASFVACMGIIHPPYSEEIVFGVSLTILTYLLRLMLQLGLPAKAHEITGACIVLFLFRATPAVGPGLQWFFIDSLHFDPAFFGVLAQTGTAISILGMWIFSKTITQKPLTWTLFYLTVLSFLLSLPTLGLIYGIQEWTMQWFGIGAREIALIDTAVSSPFDQLSMIPMLILIAKYAPQGRSATWITLMASLMNLALTGGSLLSQYLNSIFVVTREIQSAEGQILVIANYAALGPLTLTTSIIGLLPLIAIYQYHRTLLSSCTFTGSSVHAK